MRLADHDGRAMLLVDGGGVDVATASGGRFGPDIQSLYDGWSAFGAFADELRAGSPPTVPVDEARFGNPAPRPRQVFGIGLNYRAHAAESGVEVPGSPATFTKFPPASPGPTPTWSCRAATSTGRSSWWPSSGSGPTGWPRPTAGPTWPG